MIGHDKPSRAVIAVCFVLTLVPLANAQSFERTLVPIVLKGEVPGAFGSIWVTEVKAHAVGRTVHFKRFIPCQACLPTFDVAADTTVDLPIDLFRGPNDPPGALIYVDPASSPFVVFNARVSDVSRQALTWGTEIPVVRERDFFTTSLTLVNVPTDQRFRQALRIYDVDSNVETQFHIRISDDSTGESLVDDTRAVGPNPLVGTTSSMPSVVEITSLTGTYPQLARSPRIRISIEPVGDGIRFWAFVSVTNDETQHVTLVTPQ